MEAVEEPESILYVGFQDKEEDDMNIIRRDVYVLRDSLKDKIDYVCGTNAVPIYFEFRDYDIPEGASAKVFVLKPSGKAVYNACPIFGQEVRVEVTTQMFIEEGLNLLQVQIEETEQVLVTFIQPVQVHKNFVGGDATESKNESDWIDEYIQNMTEATQNAQEATQAANNAAANANEAAQVVIDQKYILTTKQTFQMEATVNPTSYGNAIIEEVDGATYQEPNPSPESPKMIYAVGDMGFFDGELLQGIYNSTTGLYVYSSKGVCSKNKIPCKSGDIIKLLTENTYISDSGVCFYQSDGTYISYSGISGDIIAPESATFFNFRLASTSDVTPSSAGHIAVTINGRYAIIFDTQNETESSRTYIPISSPLYEGDKILNVDGKYKVYRENAVLMLSEESSEQWGIWKMNANTVERYVYNFANYADKNQLSQSKSNMFIYQNNEEDIEHFRFSNSGEHYSQLIIYIDKTLAGNIDEFRAWLQSNVITVVYKLENPIYEDILQYPMYSLMAFDGETTVQLVADDNLILNNVITFPRNEDGALLTTTQAKGVYIMENIDIPSITSQLDALNNFMKQFDGKTIYIK